MSGVQVSIRARNIGQVRRGFNELANDIPVLTFGQMYGRMVSAKKKVTTYPPPIAGSRYRRTYTYRDAFQIIKTERGYMLRGRAVSPKGRDYTIFVGGGGRGEKQAQVHIGRWSPIRQAVEDAVADLPNGLRNDILMAARRRGLKTT